MKSANASRVAGSARASNGPRVKARRGVSSRSSAASSSDAGRLRESDVRILSGDRVDHERGVRDISRQDARMVESVEWRRTPVRGRSPRLGLKPTMPQ